MLPEDTRGVTLEAHAGKPGRGETFASQRTRSQLTEFSFSFFPRCCDCPSPIPPGNHNSSPLPHNSKLGSDRAMKFLHSLLLCVIGASLVASQACSASCRRSIDSLVTSNSNARLLHCSNEWTMYAADSCRLRSSDGPMRRLARRQPLHHWPQLRQVF